ncbi:hypothetical protein DAPPUDRAFT_246039 [Daphnia pulex]|uniref:Transmembrane protein n=1 Tax=Daphnia pulex TaxID=6669 RepID=E9GPJ0_DAPPU|nr:hypothetical protein DAPPUDRAFT_246039 [Daphnia pulex]|eukprot:EFX78646.1 hypothetical protein DAPPUDRAFT_246039 [Daphnia pulex]
MRKTPAPRTRVSVDSTTSGKGIQPSQQTTPDQKRQDVSEAGSIRDRACLGAGETPEGLKQDRWQLSRLLNTTGLNARRHTLNPNHGKKRKPLGDVALEKATVNNVLLPKKALLVIENAVSRFFVSNRQCFAAAAASASLAFFVFFSFFFPPLYLSSVGSVLLCRKVASVTSLSQQLKVLDRLSLSQRSLDMTRLFLTQ